MTTATNTTTTRNLLAHDLFIGPDLGRDRYRSGRARILANVLYFLPWTIAYFGWDRVRDAASAAPPGTAMLVASAVVLALLASAASLVALRRYCVYPARSAEAADQA